ncbi:MAG: DegV family protein [Anaerolineales bacterium]|nr:DegV family protein [Anaerolineales bacterium]
MVKIVTDSSAYFSDPDFARRHDVRVLPLRLRLGRQTVAEPDLTSEQLFEKLGPDGPAPVLEAPTPEEFAAVFEDLARVSDKIIAIHFSGKLSRVPQNARAGADFLLGRCQIQVVDSLSASIGLGGLVELAAEAAGRGEPIDEIVKAVRGQIPRLYGVFFTERMEYLAQARHVGRAHATLGELLNIRPCLALEEGDLVPMEKVRTRAQAIEKLVEFVVEFSAIERCAIVQPSARPTADTRALLEQLAVEFPGRRWPILPYGPSLAALLGPDAMGILIQEGAESDD